MYFILFLRNVLACDFSFYPLYPSPEDVNIDYEVFDLYSRMPSTPHVLILPSDLKQFTKVNDFT